MPAMTGSLHVAGALRAIGLGVAAIIAISVWAPAPARASGCENSWTNSKGGSWFEKENWSKKAVPTSGEEVCIGESGTYTVTMTETTGTVTVKALSVGGASGVQTLAVGSSCSLNAILTTTAGVSVTAQGALTLTNGDGCGNNAALVGTVTNAGTITTVPATGGARTIEGSLDNTGTLAINANTAYPGLKAALSNDGAIDVAEGRTLTVSDQGSVTNGSGGSIAGTGSGDVLMASRTSFTEGAGTTSGTKPVIVDDATLAYTGAGASAIATHGTTTLSGTSSPGQSLSIESTSGENAVATAPSGFTNGGSITLTNGDAAANNATLAVTPPQTLSNSGTITTEVAHGGARTIEGSLDNTGTLAINANTAYPGLKAALSNDGAIDVAEGRTLTVSDQGSVTNGSGGSIAGTGSGDVLMASGTSFTEGAGTTSGTKPVIVDDATLAYTGAGAGPISLRGSSNLSGTSSPGQSLSIESTSGENAVATAPSGFTNGGSITLTNGDGAGNNATLVISSGTLSNSGTITTEVANGGSRTIEGNLTNTGTLAINQNTAYSGVKGALSNEGAIDVASGKALTVTNAGSVTNGAGGSIVGAGSGNVFMSSGTAFFQGAGTISGTKAVIVDDGLVAYPGAGAGLIALRGSSQISGSLAAGQLLSIESTCSEHAVATAAASFTNAGSITLTNGDGCGNNATLVVSAGTLSNSGTITTEVANGGARTIQGNLKNTGTLAVNADTSYNAPGTTLTDEGQIDLAGGVTLSAPNSQTVDNETGAAIAGTGTGALVLASGSFNEGGGATTGSEPVILDDTALKYTGSGASTIALRGKSTLSGAISAGQTLSIQSSCSEHATVGAASFTSKGTIVLGNGDGCGNNAILELGSGTLTSEGTFDVEDQNGGVRELEGSIKQEGLLALGAGETLKVTGEYTQNGKGTLKTAIASSSKFGAVAVSGKAKLAGALEVVEIESFLGKAGETFAILSSSARSGTFTDLDGVITATPGRYYQPTYSATGVTLVDTRATLTPTPSEGAPGSSLTLKGTGYLPGEKVKLTFVDAKGKKSTLATVVASSGGEISAEVKLPASAAAGVGTFSATGGTITGLVVTATFTVT